MIIQAIFNVIISLFNLLLGWLPNVTALPTILGVNLDTTFSNGMGYFNRLVQIFPPLGSVMIAASTYLAFKLLMILLKLVLGHRVPHHTTT